MAASSSSDNPLYRLAEKITEYFSVSDLQHLCKFFDLDYESFPNTPKFDFAYAVGQQFVHDDKLEAFEAYLIDKRSTVQWHHYIDPLRPPDQQTVIDLQLPKGDVSPYMGLRYYRETDTERFFGRGRLSADLLARLPNPLDEEPNGHANFLPIIGASGSGKSSLVRAGMLPMLRAQGWEIRVIVPTDDPLKSLVKALSEKSVDRLDMLDRMAAGKIAC